MSKWKKFSIFFPLWALITAAIRSKRQITLEEFVSIMQLGFLITYPTSETPHRCDEHVAPTCSKFGLCGGYDNNVIVLPRTLTSYVLAINEMSVHIITPPPNGIFGEKQASVKHSPVFLHTILRPSDVHRVNLVSSGPFSKTPINMYPYKLQTLSPMFCG